ncbi:MAG TPA: hypothetical protein VFZ64_18005 [Nocardioidaceae bacterium]
MTDDTPSRRLWTGLLFLVVAVVAILGEAAAVLGGTGDWLQHVRGAALIGLFVLEAVVRLVPLRETSVVNVLRVVFIGTWLVLLVAGLV